MPKPISSETDSAPLPQRPDVPYWDDPVYRYLSRLHRAASDTGDTTEAARIDAEMQQLVQQDMPNDVYRQLDAQAKSDRKERKQSKRRSGRRPVQDDTRTEINTADLKKRVYNRNVSRDNIIKALEAMPQVSEKPPSQGCPPA